jgi:hypothetical protein
MAVGGAFAILPFWKEGNAKRKPLVPLAGTFSLVRYVRNRTRLGRLSTRSTEPDFNRHPMKYRPLLIGHRKQVGRRPSRSKNQILEICHALKKRDCSRAERLQLAAPISDDASLLKLEEYVAEYVREAKRREALEPSESVSRVLDAVARNYFRQVLLKRARVRWTPLRRQT